MTFARSRLTAGERLRDHVLDRLGRRRVDELTADDVRRLVDRLVGKGLAPGTVTSCVNILSGLLRYARQAEGRRAQRRPRPRPRRPARRRPADRAALPDRRPSSRQLLAKMSDTFRPVAAACAYAGLRVSEALGLRWRDLDLKAGTLTVAGQLGAAGERLDTTKTAASAATVPLLPVLRRELVEHRARQASRNLALVRADELVFTTARGKPQSRRNALRAAAHRRRRSRPERRRPRAGRPARPAALARRDRVRARPDRARGRGARPAREREGDAHRLRRPDRRRPREGRREAGGGWLRCVSQRSQARNPRETMGLVSRPHRPGPWSASLCRRAGPRAQQGTSAPS